MEVVFETAFCRGILPCFHDVDGLRGGEIRS